MHRFTSEYTNSQIAVATPEPIYRELLTAFDFADFEPGMQQDAAACLNALDYYLVTRRR